MFPPQTSQILLGGLTAFFYATSVMAVGVMVLGAALGRRSRAAICDRLGSVGFAWLSFVMGQGILSVVWLTLSLVGTFYSWPIWTFCALGCVLACTMLRASQYQSAKSLKRIWISFLSLRHGQSWYFWLGIIIVIIILLRGVIALLPTTVDDALRIYLVSPMVIANNHRLELLPFLSLFPLQVEMHWAALFAISNETAVTIWDYFSALSLMAGIGILAWALTSSRRVAIIAVLMMLTTLGFYDLIGGGKVDIAAAQYGIAAFLWLVLWPALGRSSIVMAGLCAGWSMAGRYTNIFLVPSLVVFAVMMVRRASRASPFNIAPTQVNKFCQTDALIGGTVAGLAVAPMLVKNWLLSGCLLPPIWTCENTPWTGLKWMKGASWISNQQTSSVLDWLSYPLDLLSYPYVWTFEHRPDMLGNISPLFLGFLPLLLLYHHSSIVRSAAMAGLAGLVWATTWWLFINKMFPYTRWVLIPLGLIAVSLATTAVAADEDPRTVKAARWLMRGSILTLLIFLLFESRAVVYAVRYVASIDNRDARYQSMPGYDVAAWLNANVQPGERIGLRLWSGYRYFLNPDHLSNSESAAELQQLWETNESLRPVELYQLYASKRFDYVVVPKQSINDTAAVLSRGVDARIAFVGTNDAVLAINKR